MKYNVGDVVMIELPEDYCKDFIGMIVDRQSVSERTFDPDRFVRTTKYGVLSKHTSRITYWVESYLRLISLEEK